MKSLYENLENLFCIEIPSAKNCLEMYSKNDIKLINKKLRNNVKKKIGKEELNTLEKYMNDHLEDTKLAQLVGLAAQEVIPKLGINMSDDPMLNEVKAGTEITVYLHKHLKQNNYNLSLVLENVSEDFSKHFLLYDILEELFYATNLEFDPLNIDMIFQKENGSKTFSEEHKKCIDETMRRITKQKISNVEFESLESCIRKNIKNPYLKELIKKVHKLTDRVYIINPQLRCNFEDSLPRESKGGAILLLGLHNALSKNSYDLEKSLNAIQGTVYSEEFSNIQEKVNQLYEKVTSDK